MSLPNWLFQTTWIYHITHIENLPSILKAGQIYATNFRSNNHTCIANDEIQDRRATKQVILSPYGVLHDYVPFYFAPRSPMLCANHKRSFTNSKPQDEIIHLVTTAQIIAENGLPYVFYDHHAATDYASCYNNIIDLDKIDWELFFETPLIGAYSQYWQDRYDENHPKWIKRKVVRQAEFMVHQTLNWNKIKLIGTMNVDRTNQIQSIVSSYGYETPVETRTDWYF
jgi:hypothetical protein